MYSPFWARPYGCHHASPRFCSQATGLNYRSIHGLQSTQSKPRTFPCANGENLAMGNPLCMEVAWSWGCSIARFDCFKGYQRVGSIDRNSRVDLRNTKDVPGWQVQQPERMVPGRTGKCWIYSDSHFMDDNDHPQLILDSITPLPLPKKHIIYQVNLDIFDS